MNGRDNCDKAERLRKKTEEEGEKREGMCIFNMENNIFSRSFLLDAIFAANTELCKVV